MKSKYMFALLLLVELIATTIVVFYMDVMIGEIAPKKVVDARVVEKRICKIETGEIIWRVTDAFGKSDFFARKAKASKENLVFSSTEKEQEGTLLDAMMQDKYFMYPNGDQFKVYQKKDGEYCVRGNGYVHCDLYKVLGHVHRLERKHPCSKKVAGIEFYQVDDLLMWANADYYFKYPDTFGNWHAEIAPISSMNRIVVYHNKKQLGAYDEISDPMFVRKRVVFVGKIVRSVDYNPVHVETSKYEFVYGDMEIPINCDVFKSRPKRPEHDVSYKELVKPLWANVCGGRKPIGLVRRTMKYIKDKKAVVERDYFFSVRGRYYPRG